MNKAIIEVPHLVEPKHGIISPYPGMGAVDGTTNFCGHYRFFEKDERTKLCEKTKLNN